MITITPFSLPLFGPLAIHGYGIAIALAVGIFVYCSYTHFKRSVPVSFDLVSGIITRSILVGIAGGRVLHIMSEWQSYSHFTDYFAIWNGGLSILGCIIALGIYVPYTVMKHKLPLFFALDTASLFAPLAHAIGRLGCLVLDVVLVAKQAFLGA